MRIHEVARSTIEICAENFLDAFTMEKGLDENRKCELQWLYGSLRADVIRSLKDHIDSGNGDLDDLKERCSYIITDQKVLKKIKTVKQLFDALEKQGAIGRDNVSGLKILAEKLGLTNLEKNWMNMTSGVAVSTYML